MKKTRGDFRFAGPQAPAPVAVITGEAASAGRMALQDRVKYGCCLEGVPFLFPPLAKTDSYDRQLPQGVQSMRISPINVHLAAAKETVKHVQGAMDIGTTNKFFDNFWGLPARLACVSEETKAIQKDMQEQLPLLRREEDPDKRRNAIAKARVETAASWGKHWGCGNCGVQSAMAFVRLRDFWKLFPLDWMQLKHGDHGFVVIGREKGTTPSTPRTWNADAVLCDPWSGVAVRMIHQSSLYHSTLDLIYRQESA